MAHYTTHRRNLAAPDPETTTMVPTSRKPKPNPSTTTAAASASAAAKNHRHPHPLPDPTVTPSSTIQNISHRFSKLYINHKKLTPHPQPEPPNFQPKNLPFSDTSCTTLTKSSSQHERNGTMMEKNRLLSSKTKKKEPRKQSFEEFDVKKALKLMPKNEGFQEGLEVKGRNSVSSIPPTISNGGRRRSFCNSQVELADFLSCSGVKVVAVDMPPFMQIHAVDCARKTHDSLEKFTSRTLAFTLKKEFDGVYGPAWHCIVGTSFGSFVTHSVGGFMYFSMDQKLYILLFKTTVQRAE